MFNHDHINGSAECGRVDRIPGLGDRATQAPNVLHPDTGAWAKWILYVLIAVICEGDAGGESANRATRYKSAKNKSSSRLPCESPRRRARLSGHPGLEGFRPRSDAGRNAKKSETKTGYQRAWWWYIRGSDTGKRKRKVVSEAQPTTV